jgi:ABC-type transport system involved in cytochrome c biogenesis permease subunit
MNVFFFKFASIFYCVGTLVYLGHIIFLKQALSRLANLAVSIGFASHTLALITRYMEAGHTPVTNLYESLSFFAWMIIGILLITTLRYQIKVLGAFLTPIALILMLFALSLPKEIVPLAPVLQSLASCPCLRLLGNAIFTLAFCCKPCTIQEYQLKPVERSPRGSFLESSGRYELPSAHLRFPLLTSDYTGAIQECGDATGWIRKRPGP